MTHGETQWPTTELEGFLDDEVTAARLGRLLEHRSEWVHRRVESVEFHDDVSVRRRISLDFTLPALAPGFIDGHGEHSLVPLTSCAAHLVPMPECPDDEFDRSDESVGDRRPAEAAALLLALPGVLAVVLTRHGEHPMTTRLLAGIRPVILTTALVLFVSAWTVVFLPASAVTGVWYVLSVVACILAGLLTVSYFGLRGNGGG